MLLSCDVQKPSAAAPLDSTSFLGRKYHFAAHSARLSDEVKCQFDCPSVLAGHGNRFSADCSPLLPDLGLGAVSKLSHSSLLKAFWPEPHRQTGGLRARRPGCPPGCWCSARGCRHHPQLETCCRQALRATRLHLFSQPKRGCHAVYSILPQITMHATWSNNTGRHQNAGCCHRKCAALSRYRIR